MQGSLVVQFPLVWFPSKYEITFLNNTSNFQIERKTLRTILEAKHVTFYNFKKSSNQMWGPYWRTHTTQARRNTSWAQPHILAEVKSSSTKDLINITYLLKFIYSENVTKFRRNIQILFEITFNFKAVFCKIQAQSSVTTIWW